MESRVDLPQPDGPDTATYSPGKTSRWTPERACVSTSSVWNTLVTPSSRISGATSFISLDLQPVAAGVVRHVRDDHLFPGLQPLQDHHPVHRGLAQLHRDAHRLGA